MLEDFAASAFDLARVILGLTLALFLPGFALMALLRPHKPALVFEWAERIFLSIVLSLALLVLVGAVLAYGPWTLGGRGLFQGSTTGAPVLETILVLLTAGFAAGAWLRARGHPAAPSPAPREAEAHLRAEKLARGEGDEDEAARELYG